MTTDPPPRGPRVVDVRDYGASPTATPAVNRRAFGDAMDALAATAARDGTPWGTVYVPSGKFLVDRPIRLRPFIGLRGEGVASLIASTTGHDVLIAGFRADVGPVDPAHFPDLWMAGPNGSPVLDPSALSGPGQRWGLRTMGDSHLAQQGGALDVGYGDGYRTPTALTIDVKMDLSRATAANRTQGCLFGITEDNHPRPFSVVLANDWITLRFRTVSPSDQFDAGTDRQVAICPVDAATGWLALTLQIDLITATVAAWRDSMPLPLDTRSLGSGWTTGLRFATNEHCPFGLGTNAPQATAVADVWGTATDLTFAGLHVVGAAVYRVGDPGSPQARLDGRPITDASRYFTRWSSTVGYLPLIDRPETIAAERIVGVIGRGGLETTGYWLGNAGHGSPGASIQAGRIEGLGIGGVSGAYGRGIATMRTQGLSVRDCSIKGGHQAIGAVNAGANYPVTIRGCTLAGSDAAVYLYYAAYATLDDITIASPTRCGLRFTLTEPTIRDVRGVYGATEYLVKSVAGGFVLSNAYWDDEGSGGASKAAFYASAPGAVNPMGPRVSITDSSAGNTAPGRPLIVLEDGGHSAIGPQSPRGLFDCRRLMIYGTPTAPIVLAGDRWSGSISIDTDLPGGPPWVAALGVSPRVRAIVAEGVAVAGA